ncbi:hypothetical protein NHP190002_14700 [Helicobacter ailurogastricus]|uniref:hypothetical protein n=1 Tax=Helicobacter TaxID=209 RepID=UPI000CF07D62|nr:MULTISPECIES: hypothetical protein [Helicobacter]GMB90752.1 hypothetical protein NHP190002_14700 [Helicobacter ailurogastricus]GMB94781.1 hypothetical protein NHP21011_08740 [Helicobacter heilmannii]
MFKFLSVFGLVALPLVAENNGVYGEVGFQYSNMTQATKSHTNGQTTKNPFLTGAPTKAVNVKNFLPKQQ